MSKYLADPKTLLVIKGVPYRLVREKFCTVFMPCRVCDLRDQCRQGNGALNFMTLCSNHGGDGGWFFKVDWECVSSRILSFIEPPADVELHDL